MSSLQHLEAFYAVNKEYVLPSADSITRQVDKTYDEAVKVISADILPVMGVVGLI